MGGQKQRKQRYSPHFLKARAPLIKEEDSLFCRLGSFAHCCHSWDTSVSPWAWTREFLLEFSLSTLRSMSGFQAMRNGKLPSIWWKSEFWSSSPIHLLVFIFQNSQIADPSLLSGSYSWIQWGIQGKVCPLHLTWNQIPESCVHHSYFPSCHSNDLQPPSGNELDEVFHRHYSMCFSYDAHYSTTFTKGKIQTKSLEPHSWYVAEETQTCTFKF